jgi:hypothetical protein
MPTDMTISVPVCEGEDGREIDHSTDGEEWGDATAVLTAPYAYDLLGHPDVGWCDRDAVLILIPISDEGPQDGGGVCPPGNDIPGQGPCEENDAESVCNLIAQSILRNAQVIPFATPGMCADCIYDYMEEVALDTQGGNAVDARSWTDDNGSNQLLQATLDSAIRDAIASSPRINCDAGEVTECAGDLDRNRVVDGADMGLFLSDWGASCSPADLNGDGLVNGADLGLLLVLWGACP